MYDLDRMICFGFDRHFVLKNDQCPIYLSDHVLALFRQEQLVNLEVNRLSIFDLEEDRLKLVDK